MILIYFVMFVFTCLEILFLLYVDEGIPVLKFEANAAFVLT